MPAVYSGRGVEQRQLVGLITRRSSVRIRPPQPNPEFKPHIARLGFLVALAPNGATKSGMVKAVRQLGVSAAGYRIRDAFDSVTKSGKSKKAKGAAAKI